MATLNNKIDFALVFTVRNANPNGDPLGATARAPHMTATARFRTFA